jgi:hypothetical protein
VCAFQKICARDDNVKTVSFYEDGTRIILINGRVVSASPGSSAVETPGQVYTIERQGRQIIFDPAIVGSVIDEAHDSFMYAPPNHAVIETPSSTPPPVSPLAPTFVPLKRIRLF